MGVAEQESANISGGQVMTLLGNHEVMNLLGDYRYVNPAELAALADSKQINGVQSQDKKSTGLAVWQEHMHQVCKFNKAMRATPAYDVLMQRRFACVLMQSSGVATSKLQLLPQLASLCCLTVHVSRKSLPCPCITIVWHHPDFSSTCGC